MLVKKTKLQAVPKYILKIICIPFELLSWGVSFLIPKNKKLIVISEWKGQRFSDNCAAVFIEMQEKPDIQVVWISNNNTALALASPYGPAFSRFSIIGLYYQCTAKTFICGSGKSDFIRSLITPRSTLINLWHGPPIKNIYLLNVHQTRKKWWLLIRTIRNKLLPFFDETPNYILASNHHYKSIMESAFNPKSGVLVAPLPRWKLGKLLLKNSTKCNLDASNNNILYAPTFRDSNLAFLPISSEELRVCDDKLLQQDAWMFISLHPACQYKPSRSYKRIIFFDEALKEEVNLYAYILPKISAVITDISSLSIDAFAYDIKPYIYFPDWVEYQKKSRGLIFDIHDLYKDNVRYDFLKLLDAYFEGEKGLPESIHGIFHLLQKDSLGVSDIVYNLIETKQ